MSAPDATTFARLDRAVRTTLAAILRHEREPRNANDLAFARPIETDEQAFDMHCVIDSMRLLGRWAQGSMYLNIAMQHAGEACLSASEGDADVTDAHIDTVEWCAPHVLTSAEMDVLRANADTRQERAA